MQIDWAAFTPWSCLGGGVLIGLAAALLVLLDGRIAGISGIVGRSISTMPDVSGAWGLCFILGLVIAGPLWSMFAALPFASIAASTPVLLVAGLLVGVGTRFASGCTSGHGVCGLARGSMRSLVATATFMALGFLTVFALRHV